MSCIGFDYLVTKRRNKYEFIYILIETKCLFLLHLSDNSFFSTYSWTKQATNAHKELAQPQLSWHRKKKLASLALTQQEFNSARKGSKLYMYSQPAQKENPNFYDLIFVDMKSEGTRR